MKTQLAVFTLTNIYLHLPSIFLVRFYESVASVVTSLRGVTFDTRMNIPARLNWIFFLGVVSKLLTRRVLHYCEFDVLNHV